MLPAGGTKLLAPRPIFFLVRVSTLFYSSLFLFLLVLLLLIPPTPSLFLTPLWLLDETEKFSTPRGMDRFYWDRSTRLRHVRHSDKNSIKRKLETIPLKGIIISIENIISRTGCFLSSNSKVSIYYWFTSRTYVQNRIVNVIVVHEWDV